MKLVKSFQVGEGAYPVELYQYADGEFKVVYGAQQRGPLTYREAYSELGRCLFHAMSCEGLFDAD